MLDTENRTTLNGNKGRLENLELLDQIHQDALWVFEDAGIKCDLPEVRRIFGVTGTVTFDESIGHLYVLESFVEQPLATTPNQIIIGFRDTPSVWEVPSLLFLIT